MKYAVLTDLNLLTDDLRKEIVNCADINTLQKVVYISQGTVMRSTHSYEEQGDDYKFINNKSVDCGSGFFAICEIPNDLHTKLYNRLPTQLQQLNPRIRIQLLQDFKLFPHIDVNGRKTSLFTMVTDNDIDSVFWDVTHDHEFIEGHVADINLIEQRMRIRFKPNETWLFNHNNIHGTTESSSKLRISINYGYNIGMKEMLKYVIGI